MQIFLIRHADAIDPSMTLPDQARWLQPKGRAVARGVGARLAQEGVEFDAIVCSPFVRAVQTAELLAAATGYVGEIVALMGLTPGAMPAAVAMDLPTRGVRVAVVGHEPTISGLAAVLVNRPAFPPFRPGQVVLIDQGLPSWTLRPDTLELDRVLLA